MVVIKALKADLEKKYGREFTDKVRVFSEVIGYSVEDGNEYRVELNPDRPDLFSFQMLSHSISCFENTTDFKIPHIPFVDSEIEVDPKTRKVRRYISGLYAKGPEIGDNLETLIDYQEKIHSSIGRDRKKLSIGLHDLDQLVPPFTFSMCDSGNTEFETYDSLVTGKASDILKKHPKGIEYGYLIPDKASVPILRDSAGNVLSMPPVVNGKKSLVTKSTSSFLIDVTGDDKISLRYAIYCLSYMLLSLGYSVNIFTCEPENRKFIETFNGRKYDLSHKEISTVTGFKMEERDIAIVLAKMGFQTKVEEKIVVNVPGNRGDVMGKADIIEDLAKGFGYSGIISRKPHLSLIGEELPERKRQREIRTLLIGLGFQEIMSYVVTSSRLYGDGDYVGGVNIMNPKSQDFSYVRDRLYLNMLDFLRLNRSNSLPQKVFEIGDVVVEGKQETHLSIGLTHSKANYSEIHSIVSYLLGRITDKTIKVKPTDNQHLISGRSGTLLLGSYEYGILGEVNPETLIRFELQNPASIAEFRLDQDY